MKKTIWKYPITTNDCIGLDLPVGAEILDIQIQNDMPCIWALVDPEAIKVNRTFYIYGTGHVIEYSCSKEYIGTYQLFGGELVFHVFELKE